MNELYSAHNFKRSQRVEQEHAQAVRNALLQAFPKADIEQLPEGRTEGQLRGHDWQITLPSGKTYFIDSKVDMWTTRNFVVEMWSNKEKGKVGWAIDLDKTNDYYLYLYPRCGYAYLIDRHLLNMATFANADEWKAKYGTRKINNGGYHTVIILIPDSEVIRQFGISCKLDTIPRRHNDTICI